MELSGTKWRGAEPSRLRRPPGSNQGETTSVAKKLVFASRLSKPARGAEPPKALQTVLETALFRSTDSIIAVAISPDGVQIATGSQARPAASRQPSAVSH